MAKRYRSKIVLKLFPSVPRGVFGGGWITRVLEKRLFYREFHFGPWKLAFLTLVLVAGAAWSTTSLLLAWNVLDRAEVERARAAEEAAAHRTQLERLNRARRDYYVLLSRLRPLNEKVDELAEFSRKMAIVAGVEGLAAELATDASERDLDMELSERELQEIERKFQHLSRIVENKDFELTRTPSISPLKDSFVPTDRFGFRVDRFTRERGAGVGGNGRQFHAGLDLAAPVGTPIYATADATVHFAGRIPRKQSPRVAYYGNFVVLDHGNGVRTVYAHCDRLNVEAGQEVTRGDVIAWVGNTGRSTGPHVHYEVVVNGRPVDPELFVLDVDIPDKRVRVEFDSPSLLVEEVDRLLGL